MKAARFRLRIQQTEGMLEDSRELAFTLVELLVVLVSLGVLGAVVLPALARNEGGAQSFQCMSNLKRLLAGWQMYAADNLDQLVYNTDGGNTGKYVGGPYDVSWVGGWLTTDYTIKNDSDNTNILLLIQHDLPPAITYEYCGFLGPYVKSPDLFKCPADKLMVTMGDQEMPRVRSYSMNKFVGMWSRTWLGEHAAQGIGLAQLTGSSKYRLMEKFQQILSPSLTFVMLDELPESINDGNFFTNPDASFNLIDYPSSHHNGGGALSFADGHAEIHKWTDPRTVPVVPPGAGVLLNVILPGDADVTWLGNRATGTP